MDDGNYGRQGQEDARPDVEVHPAEEYDHVVLRVQDVTELEWKTDAKRLEAALAEAASLVRVPVVAGVKLHPADEAEGRRGCGRSGGQGVSPTEPHRAHLRPGLRGVRFKRAAARAEGSDQHQPADRLHPGRVAGKRPRDGEVDDEPRAPIWVLAASYRLLFALESMLAYLVRSRASATPITLDVNGADKKYVEIVLTGSVRSVEPNGELEEARRGDAHRDCAGRARAREDCPRMRGHLKRQWQKDSQEQLSLRLKLARH